MNSNLVVHYSFIFKDCKRLNQLKFVNLNYFFFINKYIDNKKKHFILFCYFFDFKIYINSSNKNLKRSL